jgi:hypothetical protein
LHQIFFHIFFYQTSMPTVHQYDESAYFTQEQIDAKREERMARQKPERDAKLAKKRERDAKLAKKDREAKAKRELEAKGEAKV